jgi:cob(I)alamin adenosyltransferase
VVKLNRIYTKAGDKGTTMLGDGATVPKHALRVETYGTVDEANAAIGVAITALDTGPLRDALLHIQNELFDVGADLCVPVAKGEAPGKALRVTPHQVERLEKLIDEHNERLEPLSSFVLPGGAPPAAHLHLARTVVRRAERLVTRLLEAEPDATNPQTMIYLNRLSDLLFVLARVANDRGKKDVLWKPGEGRE